MCYYLLHTIITKSLSSESSKSIEITRMDTKRNDNTGKMMRLCCHLMKRKKKAARQKTRMIKKSD